MIRKLSFLTLCFCFLFTGQITGQQSALKHVKDFKKVSKRQALQLRSTGENPPEATLRALLEPEHNHPLSATYYSIIEGEQYPNIQRRFTYNGDIITEKSYISYEDIWVDVYTEEYAFDMYGNRILKTFLMGYNNRITSGSKVEYSYNPNGTQLFLKYSRWENEGWTLFIERKYQCDASGMLTGGTYMEDGKTSTLTVTGTLENREIYLIEKGEKVFSFLHHYDPATMRLLGEENFYPNEQGILELREKYLYDAAGRLSEEIWKDEDEEDEVEYYKYEYVYDNAGRKLSVTYSSSPKIDNDAYTIYEREEYEYVNNRLSRIKEYELNETGILEYSGIAIFSYSTGTGQTPSLDVSVSPNPVTDAITVSGAYPGSILTVTDISGRAVIVQRLNSEYETAPATSLPAGYYIVTVKSNQGTSINKIIKK